MSAQQVTPLGVGSVLGDYRIDGVLGKGGMATVYEATELSLDRQVALKVISAELGEQLEFRERFRREAVQQAKLDHVHIVPVYRADEIDGRLFIAMRLIRGSSLKDLAANGLDAKRSLHILDQAASALDAAHSAGVVHRDVKPQNILVDANDSAYLADFGLVKGRGDRSLTNVGRNVGTLDYLSPEQINDLPADERSDIYAFTAVLYECLAGEVPYNRDSDAAILMAHLQDAPPPLSEQSPGLPSSLDAVIERGMAKDPAARPHSATELMQLAHAALLNAAPAAPRRARGETMIDAPTLRTAPSAVVPPAPGLGTRIAASVPRPRIALPVAAVVVVLGVVLGVMLGRSGSSTAATGTKTVADGHLAVTLATGAALPFSAAIEQTPAVAKKHASIELGHLQALSYRAGGKQVFAIPTTAGTVVIRCAGSGCDRVVATGTLVHAKQLPVGPNASFAGRLEGVLRPLGVARREGRASLARATTPAAQHAAAAKLASAYTKANVALAHAFSSTGERAQVASLSGALKKTAAAYVALAHANAAGFSAAAHAVGRAETTVSDAITAFRSAGYRVNE